jgi:hypothetical protein
MNSTTTFRPAPRGAGPFVIHRADQLQAVDFEDAFKGSVLTVIDDVKWEADLHLIRSALVKTHRGFKAPFIEKEPPKLVRKELRILTEHAERLFKQLYPSFKSVATRTSFRPMITGPEPLHFDTYGGEAPMVTAYINVSKVPRVYGIGPSFPMLVRDQPTAMQQLVWEVGVGADLSYAIRQRTADGLPPLGKDAPRHRVELAPGAIWFFNAKTVSHEVIHGTGALGISWEVPGCGAPMQADFLKAL